MSPKTKQIFEPNLRVNKVQSAYTRHKYVGANPKACTLVTNGLCITALRDGLCLHRVSVPVPYYEQLKSIRHSVVLCD